MKKIKHLIILIGLLPQGYNGGIGLGGDEIPAEGLARIFKWPTSPKQIEQERDSEDSNSLCAVFYGDNNEYKDKTDCF